MGCAVAEQPRLVLASTSPSRAALLRAAGLAPHIVASRVDEEALAAAAAEHGNDPHALTQLLADAKAADVAGRGDVRAGDLVLGADSMLFLAGRLLGKAGSADEVRRRWQWMAGRTGTLVTGHALIDVATGRWARAAVGTTIHFGRPDPQELEAYIDSGEPLEVAGSCTIEGLGSAFVEGIEGDHSNVIGLSLPTVRRLAGGLGVRWTDLWERPDRG